MFERLIGGGDFSNAFGMLVVDFGCLPIPFPDVDGATGRI